MNVADRSRGAVRREVGIRDLVPVGLTIVAEAAWITVVASLVQEYALRPASLGIPGFALFVAGGTVAAVTLRRPLGADWPVAALGLAAVAGLIGCLASPGALSALVAGDLGQTIASHPGGWLASVAVIRGFAHANDLSSGDAAESLLQLGIPGIAVAAILGGAVAEPWRAAFLSEAFIAASVFGVTATLGLALRRLSIIGRDAGFDWAGKPAGAALLAIALVSITVLAGQMTGVIGGGIQLTVAIALGPLTLMGFVFGWDRTQLRLILGLLLVSVLVLVAALVFGRPENSNLATSPGATEQPPETSQGAQLVTMGVATLAMAGAIVVVLFLVRRWMRSSDGTDLAPVRETRWVDIRPSASPTSRGFWPRRPQPRDGAAAYVALMDDLDRREAVKRRPSETPFEHAVRLRGQLQGALSLDLLAADYALVRFKQTPLTDHEHRRAIDRWRLLRRRLGRAGPRADVPRPDVPEIGSDD
jgi:hypothetical protein